MPRGPRGEKRPADVIGNAVKIMRMAIGEETEELPKSDRLAAGRRGGPARAKTLSPKQRSEIARAAAQARWKRST